MTDLDVIRGEGEYQEAERLLTELRRTIKADLAACADEIGPAAPLVARLVAIMDARNQAGPEDDTTASDLAMASLMRVLLLAEDRILARKWRR
ncbi:MAG: hypothetical protein M3O34_10310 [Chloroflexota bacterium]|nr:hypothetical protein [Chloroflexota bacterium]